ncbi:MAG: DUF2782 domain-containing protein [Pseudomonadales bacterium]|nr:DUF2782 domain-containing protein [Pseudomonadales bacterium]
MTSNINTFILKLYLAGLVGFFFNTGYLNAASALEALKGPDVVIIEGDKRTVYEYRQSGQLRMIRIVPKTGKPYYLVPVDQTQNFGDLEKADKLVKQWVLVKF